MTTYPIYPVGTGAELNLTRFYEDERIKLSGQVIQYWVLNRGANVDPLYNEPTQATNDPLYGETYVPEKPCGNWAYSQVQLIAAIEYQQYDNENPQVDENGLSKESDATMFLSYLQWDSVVGVSNGVPKEGDVVLAMNTYFDIKKAGSEGNLVDTANVVGYKLELVRRDKFAPEKKL